MDLKLREPLESPDPLDHGWVNPSAVTDPSQGHMWLKLEAVSRKPQLAKRRFQVGHQSMQFLLVAAHPRPQHARSVHIGKRTPALDRQTQRRYLRCDGGGRLHHVRDLRLGHLPENRSVRCRPSIRTPRTAGPRLATTGRSASRTNRGIMMARNNRKDKSL